MSDNPLDFLDNEQSEDVPPDQDDLNLMEVMKTRNGRAFIAYTLDSFGLWDDTYSSNANEHARFAGLRGAGIMLENRLKDVTPANYNLMMKEKYNG